MDCYSCDQPAAHECRRCARTYCPDHGNESYCADCLRPASALPSFNLYRGALLTMLVGTAVAVFLIIRPPGNTSGAPAVIVGNGSATPAASDTTPLATTTGTSDTTATPASAATATSTPEPTKSPYREYVVQQGDTLWDIATNNAPPGDDLAAFVDAIIALNNLNPDAELEIGRTLLLPPLPSDTQP